MLSRLALDSPPLRRLLLVVAVMAAPTAAALIVLVATGNLAAGPALAALVAVAVLLAVPIRRHLRHLAAVAAALEAMASGEMANGKSAGGAAPPALGPAPSSAAPELAAAAALAGRAWTARRSELEAVVTASETILSSLPDPLILLDADRRVVRANPAADALFGHKAAGRELFAMLRNPALIEAVDAAMGGGGGRVVEFTQGPPPERSLSARVERLPQPLVDGTICLITLHDLSQVKQADRMRADFVANASHELRTPLSTLSGFIETLMGPARDDAEAREKFLGIMHEQAARMARLVADLLSLSRIELNEHRVPQDSVPLGRVLGSVADILQLKARDKGMTIELGAALPARAADRPDEPAAEEAAPGGLAGLPAVSGDADELAQLFQNLLDNAIKYGRSGSTIRVSGWVAAASSSHPGERSGAARPARLTGRIPPHAVAIAIADEGEGIPREHLPRLTERFYRVDSARSRDLGGTGLGLAIVKHIVSRHRGGLLIESTPGQGSIFTVLLPVSPGTEKPEAAARR